MPALARTNPDRGKPVLLPIAQDLLRDAMRARGKSVTALACDLGMSRKHLSNVLNGHSSPTLRLLLDLGAATGVDSELLICLLDYGPQPDPAPYGFMKGTIEVLCDPTEPMTDWEMLET